jgi:hypothetical protein
VNKATLVGGVERTRHLRDNAHGLLCRQWPFGEELLEIRAADVAHRDVQLACDLACVVDGNDVRVIDRRSQPRLGQKPLAEVLVLGQFRRKDLQRHVAVESEIVGAIDDTHPATADLRLQPIAGEFGPDA